MFGISHYPTCFEGYYIDYTYSKYQHTCGHKSYPAYKIDLDLKLKIPQGLLYCPKCQILFREPKTMNFGPLYFG